MACDEPRRKWIPWRLPTRTGATPPSATGRPHLAARSRRAGWAGRAKASSACTPTTPGTSPAVTTRSGAGSPNQLELQVLIEPATTTFHHAGADTTVAVGPATLVANELAGSDPPGPPS